MKINLAIIISALVLLIGYFTNQPYLWIPLSVLIAGIIGMITLGWVNSNRLGSAQTFSLLLKLLFSLIGLYATLGQFVCVGLLTWWFVF